jgi:purine-cytosine permease-like protein
MRQGRRTTGREPWAWSVVPALLMGVIAYVGESRLHAEPDWVILAVAIGAGLLIAVLLRVARARRR